jgi:ATPase involved in DNA replication initiation
MPDLRRQISDPRDLGETATACGGAGTSEAWMRIRRRLRVELGEEVFSSWFGCLELEALSGQDVCLSVPTKFLKSWIQSHYVERILPTLASEFPAIKRVSINVVPRHGKLLPVPMAGSPISLRALAWIQQGAGTSRHLHPTCR